MKEIPVYFQLKLYKSLWLCLVFKKIKGKKIKMKNERK